MKIDEFFFDDWTYGVLDPNAPASDFDYFESFVTIWQKKRSDGLLPARKDFNFDEFRNWYGWVAIDEIHYDPFDMVCTLCGTEIVSLQGMDQTGMRLSQFMDMPEERLYYEPYLACHKLAVENKLFTHGIGSLIHTQKRVGMEWVGLPCANDGEKITHFISLTRHFPIADLKTTKIKPLTELI